ncbi:MAG TPA: hypothetical protein VJM34_15880 [Novosphingobium sp.]|nr:hypothetical protein [Novosphingobium sp.]
MTAFSNIFIADTSRAAPQKGARQDMGAGSQEGQLNANTRKD